MNRKITIFENITITDKPNYISIKTAIERIKTGKSKDRVSEIRKEKDKEKRNDLKKLLPSYCFSGIFKTRSNNGIIKHTGLIAIDFDNIDNLSEFNDRIEKDPYTFISFVSPSGAGLKVIVKIPNSIDTHEKSLKALEKYYNVPNFDKLKDVARVCYESWDPDIFVNPDSKLFEKVISEDKPKQQINPVESETDHGNIYNNIKVWIEKECQYIEGERHNFLVKFAAACNRFGIPEGTAVMFLKLDYLNDGFPERELNSIAKSVYSNYSFNYGTSFFDAQVPKDIKTKKKLTKEVFNINLPLKDIVYLDNVWDSMVTGFHNGYTRGETTYFPEIDNHFRWMKGEITFLGGIGNYGKSTFLYFLCLIKAVKDGYKWAIFSPEQYPANYFYNDLIHSYIGMSTEKFHDNQMDFKEYVKARDFIRSHFFYVYPEDEAPTPDYINERFEQLIIKHKIDGCITDPYNQLDNDLNSKGGREDQYISEYATKEKRFAQKYNVFKITVGHPKFFGLKKDDLGNYEVPNVGDYSGGAMWNNKYDNILCYHRPFFKSDPGNSIAWFISQKIKKQKLNGIPGISEVTLNRPENRFYEKDLCPLKKLVKVNTDGYPETWDQEEEEPWYNNI